MDEVDRKRDQQEKKSSRKSKNDKSSQHCNLFDGIQSLLEHKKKVSRSDLECNEFREEQQLFDNNRVLKQHMSLLEALETDPARVYEKYFETNENYRVCMTNN